MPIVFPYDYGYVLGAGALNTVVAGYHAFLTSKARKAAKVSYPTTSVSTQEADADPLKFQLNCAQRAHSNFLENYTSTLFSLLVGGITQPKAAAALGVVWAIGRVIYARSYVSKGPKARHDGGFAFLAQIALMGLSFWTSFQIMSSGW